MISLPNLTIRKVIVVDINNERLRLAEEMGADETINSLEVDLKTEVMKKTNGDGFPRLVEASGASKLVDIVNIHFALYL